MAARSAHRMDSGWQYALADLSLILFMVCALALTQAPKKEGNGAVAAGTAARSTMHDVVLGEAAAVWRAERGMPDLAEWIAGETIDPRQRLTIVAHYRFGSAADAFARSNEALRRIKSLPPWTRIVVEPGASDDLGATLTWDLGQR